jgi:phosphate:Na+ symporter
LSIVNVIALLGGVALFLFGMALMGDGLKKVAGSKLELVLYRLTSTPLKGVLLGTGVTAVIQSSSATSVMVVGFVNSGMMKVRQAIGIVLGAILGTSVTGWILCLSDLGGSDGGWTDLLSTSTLSALVAVVGIILRMFSKRPSYNHVGDILLGFAVLMFGMQSMSASVAPLRDSATFISLLTRFSNPLLGILVGLVFTSILQSASAAVGILQALSITGTLTLSVAFPITLGIAIGAAVPVLLSALGANKSGKRTAFAYLLIDVLGVIIWGSLFYLANAIFHFTILERVMNTVDVALLNTLFRFATVAVLAPAIPLLEKMVRRLIPDKPEDSAELAIFDRLEERFIQHPALAIEQSRIVINSMAEHAKENLFTAFSLCETYTDSAFHKVEDQEDIIDRYEDKLGTYLISITRQELTKEQGDNVSKYLHTLNDFERISDHALNVAQSAKELYEKKVSFSPAAAWELETMVAAVTEIVSLSVRAFLDNDLDLAKRVEPLEEVIDGLCDEMKLHHVERLQAGSCTLSHGFVFNDLLTNFERVSDHCSNIAVAIIELQSDAFDTHEYLNSVKALHSDGYNNYYEHFSQRYHL